MLVGLTGVARDFYFISVLTFQSSKISMFTQVPRWRDAGCEGENESHEYFEGFCFNYEFAFVFLLFLALREEEGSTLGKHNLRSLTSITDIISICSQRVKHKQSSN